MSNIIVIPARYHSTRFPGKPLALIQGKSMIRRCWEIACCVSGIDEVVVATDDERILNHAKGFGATAVMTDSTCRNGTERMFAAIQELSIKPTIAINFQGDTPLTPPWILQSLLDTMLSPDQPGMATPACQLQWQQYNALLEAKKSSNTSGTTVTFDKQLNALYFSKNVIPFLRQYSPDSIPVYQHIGIYAFRLDYLTKYVELTPTPLEQAESLEQLRALEHGLRIKISLVDYRQRTPWSVDCQEDIIHVEEIIAREGELIS